MTVLATHTAFWPALWASWQAVINQLAPKLVVSVTIVIVTITLTCYSRTIARRFCGTQQAQRPLVRFITNLFTSAIAIIGLITALATAGVNVAALLTSLGLLGFSLGLAFKDLLSNSIAGVMLLVYQPFKLKDTIKINTAVGQVIDINLRYTTLISEEQARILIPNQTLLNNTITVIASMGIRSS